MAHPCLSSSFPRSVPEVKNPSVDIPDGLPKSAVLPPRAESACPI